jgi:hypothetical protein
MARLFIVYIFFQISSIADVVGASRKIAGQIAEDFCL